VQLTLLSGKKLAKIQTRNAKSCVREELLSRLAHRGYVREIELQENGLLSRLLFQLRDCRVRFGRAAGGQVDLCVMIEECLDSFLANASIAT
jgi:hypothetical protein